MTNELFSLDGLTRGMPESDEEKKEPGVVKQMGAAARDEVEPALANAAGRLVHQLITPITDWRGAKADEETDLCSSTPESEPSEASSAPESSGPGALGLLAQIAGKAAGKGAKALGRASKRKLEQRRSENQPALEEGSEVIEREVIDLTKDDDGNWS